jgi:hypothetical protein
VRPTVITLLAIVPLLYASMAERAGAQNTQSAATPAATGAPPPAATSAPAAQTTIVFSTEQIDQMVAPIALYPDQLLAQVFMASTYPLEVVLADRWVSAPENAALKGDQLVAALDQQSWDPSVKSLVPFPPVLKMMSDQVDWTQRLGDAFLAQRKDVMDSVQRLRRQAQAAGTLKTNDQQKIVVEPASYQQAIPATPAVQEAVPQASAPPVQSAAPPQETIIIQPANPETVYVPSYNPSTAYGTWPYPSYPPSYYPYPSYYPIGAGLVSGMAFAAGVGIVGSMWGWGDCNWGGGDVNINANKYNNINRSNIQAGRATQLPANGSWRHDPSHRGGVGYRDAGSRQQFQRGSQSGLAGNNFRGRDAGQSGLAQRGARATPAAASAAGRGQLGNTAGNRQAGNRAAAGQRAGTGTGTAARGQRASAGSGAAGRANAGNRAATRPTAAQNRANAGGNLGARSAQPRAQASAFQGMGSGSQVRSQANRGFQSRQAAGQRSGGFSGARSAGGGGARASAGGGARGGGGGGGARGGGGGGGGARGGGRR